MAADLPTETPDTVLMLQRRVEALEHEVTRLRHITNNVPGMVYQFLLRPDGWMGFIYVSEGSREIYGHSPEEIVGNFKLAFEQVHAEDVASFSKSVSDSAKSLQSYKWEGRLLRNGEVRWIQAASRPVLQADRSILWDGVILDITHRKQADAALAQSFQDQETIRLQGELLMQLSTPMIPITNRVMVIPLIGRIDSVRSEQILQSILDGVERNHSAVIIIDVTGVHAVDTHTVATIVRAAKAVELLGAKVILTGIGAAVAHSLIEQNIDLSGIRTSSTLQVAIAQVLPKHSQRTQKD